MLPTARGAAEDPMPVPLSECPSTTRSGTAPRHLVENARGRSAMWRDFRLLGELFLLALGSGFASLFALMQGYLIFSVVFATFVAIASVRLVRQGE